MKLAAIQDYRTMITTDHASALLSCADYRLDRDEVLVLELTSNNRTTVHKARIASADTAPFAPLFHSWHGKPCNWKG